jgi:hypothetical protein
MTTWKRAFLCGVVVSGLSSHANAADTAKALQEITDTANKLCGDVAQKGHTNRVQIQGDVKTELNGLVKRLADLGVTGRAMIDDTEYVGVVQDQLADTLKISGDVRYRYLIPLKES